MIADKDGMVSKYDIIHIIQDWMDRDHITEEQRVFAYSIIGLLASNDYEEDVKPVIVEPPKEEPKKADPVKPAPKKTKRKTIDKGKIGALYKAGWNVVKIADEMRCSQSAVYNAIKEMGL